MQAASIYYARKGGTVVWFGCSPMDGKVDVNAFYFTTASLGSADHSTTHSPLLAPSGCWAVKKYRVDNLISHRIPLPDYLKVFDLFGKPDTMKLMVRTD